MDFKGENNPFYGKKHTIESKLKISLSRKNRKPKQIFCISCNKIILSKTHNKKYCDHCKRKVAKEWMKKNDAKRNKNPKRILQKNLIKRRYNHSKKGRLKNNLWKKTELGKINSWFSNLKRREREANMERGYTKKELLEKIEKAKENGFCQKCGNKFTIEPKSLHEITIDHKPPLYKAPPRFRYTIKMLNPICRSCNSKQNQHYKL